MMSESGEIERKDKMMIVCGPITDLYLFEGTSMRKSNTSATTKLSTRGSWKKMKRST